MGNADNTRIVVLISTVAHLPQLIWTFLFLQLQSLVSALLEITPCSNIGMSIWLTLGISHLVNYAPKKPEAGNHHYSIILLLQTLQTSIIYKIRNLKKTIFKTFERIDNDHFVNIIWTEKWDGWRALGEYHPLLYLTQSCSYHWLWELPTNYSPAPFKA